MTLRLDEVVVARGRADEEVGCVEGEAAARVEVVDAEGLRAGILGERGDIRLRRPGAELHERHFKLAVAGDEVEERAGGLFYRPPLAGCDLERLPIGERCRLSKGGAYFLAECLGTNDRDEGSAHVLAHIGVGEALDQIGIDDGTAGAEEHFFEEPLEQRTDDLVGVADFADGLDLAFEEGDGADARFQKREVDLHLLDEFACDEVATFVLDLVGAALADSEGLITAERLPYLRLGDRPESGEDRVRCCERGDLDGERRNSWAMRTSRRWLPRTVEDLRPDFALVLPEESDPTALRTLRSMIRLGDEEA